MAPITARDLPDIGVFIPYFVAQGIATLISVPFFIIVAFKKWPDKIRSTPCSGVLIVLGSILLSGLVPWAIALGLALIPLYALGALLFLLGKILICPGKLLEPKEAPGGTANATTQAATEQPTNDTNYPPAVDNPGVADKAPSAYSMELPEYPKPSASKP
ncbi:hypothetical protein V8F20_008212 [Naviculisporaceae sp. PSN 640]